MGEQEPSRMEQILDLLAQEIQQRIREPGRDMPVEVEPVPPAEASPPVAVPAVPVVQPMQPDEPDVPEDAELDAGPEPPEEQIPPVFTGPFHAARLMGRMAIWVLVAIVLVNIPFNRHGTTLATAMPDAASYVIRDGFVVKEEDDPKIYVYQDGAFRWISSLEAFDHLGYEWRDVHVVPNGYLDPYPIGAPLHVLFKCEYSPHIYRIEEGKKRWIRDIDTFTTEGHVWEDVRFVSCPYLRGLPDGETIPPDSGPPPQP